MGALQVSTELAAAAAAKLETQDEEGGDGCPKEEAESGGRGPRVARSTRRSTYRRIGSEDVGELTFTA